MQTNQRCWGRRPSAMRAAAIGIGIFALALGGCTTTHPWGFDLGDYQAAPRDLLGVQHVGHTHLVKLSGRYGSITPAEREKLHAFIVGIGSNRPESLRVGLRGATTGAAFKAVANQLIADGVDPANIGSAVHAAPPPPGTVAVIVERALAIQPNCPGWVDHPSAPADNMTNPNFGCADVSNFAAMIGDPHHLVAGASTIYHDAERALVGVAAYRADKVKDLPPINQTFTVK